jgi:hypothetical protein
MRISDAIRDAKGTVIPGRDDSFKNATEHASHCALDQSDPTKQKTTEWAFDLNPVEERGNDECHRDSF